MALNVLILGLAGRLGLAFQPMLPLNEVPLEREIIECAEIDGVGVQLHFLEGRYHSVSSFSCIVVLVLSDSV